MKIKAFLKKFKKKKKRIRKIININKQLKLICLS